MMDKRDIALQMSCPVAGVPKFSELGPLERNGERILLAANGTFLEVNRPWIRVVVQVGPPLTTTVPFGELKPAFEFKAARLPRALLQEFVEWAQKDHHVEIGAVITWDEKTGQYALLRAKSTAATADHLDYELPPLPEGVHIVVDCHSHSHGRAFFSSTDDEDDQHALKYSFVVGHCNTDNPSIASRLCVRGVLKNLSWNI